MSETRLESFPFDSLDGEFDSDGYPIYDRAVGAEMLGATFENLFRDGVLPNPEGGLKIRGSAGLYITLGPGFAVLGGRWGRVKEGENTFQLESTSPTVGKCAYGVFFRRDDNVDKRSCYISIRKGTQGTDPTPPEPDTSPGVREIRLGYVILPSGATDIGSGTIVDERGTSSCPFAQPYFDIDASSAMEEIKARVEQSYIEYKSYVDQYIDLLMSAVDGTTAGDLANRMTSVELTVSEMQNTLNGYNSLLLDTTGVE